MSTQHSKRLVRRASEAQNSKGYYFAGPKCPSMRELIWVDTSSGLKEMVARAKDADILALDAEMDSFFCYHTKLCLVQLSVGTQDYLIDPLAITDLSLLNEITQDSSIRKVFHAGENDVPYFRQRGVEFSNIFDTHLAAKLLDLPTKSLGGLVERYFEVVLPKDQSRADWRIRPLPEEQVTYAQQDTCYLCPLAEILTKELQESGILTEASQGFRMLESLSLRVKAFEPQGWAKIKGAKELTGVQRSVLQELYAWREREAESADLAVFRIAHNGALLGLSRKRFRNIEQLKDWAKAPIFKEHAAEIFQLIEKGHQRGPIPFPELRKRNSEDWSAADEKLFEKLRKWRNEESEKRGIDPSRVFSNRQLKTVARSRPVDAQGLAKLEGVEAWKVEQYGDMVLEVVGAQGG